MMETTFDSANTRPPVINEFIELWRYRDLLRLLIANSIKTRYKRSTLGVVWTLLNPLLTTIVLTIAFSQLFRFDLENYPVYILVSLVFWNFFSQTTTAAMNTVIWGSSLVKRIYVPRTIFAVSVLGNGLVNLLLALIPLFIIMLFLGHPFKPTILFLPYAILILALFTLGFSLLIAAVAVFFVDVVEIYQVAISALFYVTPIIYPISIVPERFSRILKLNPLLPMLTLFRSPIYTGEIPLTSTILIATGLSILTLFFGWWFFTKRANEFAYRI